MNGEVPILDPSKKPIPESTPVMTIFAGAGALKFPLRAYRCTSGGIEFIPYLPNGEPKDAVEIILGQALISDARGFELNVEEIDALYEKRGSSLVLQG